MEMSISRQFSLVCLNPDTGRIRPQQTKYKFALAGAFLLDFYRKGEIMFQDNRIVPGSRRNSDPLHDRLAEALNSSDRPRRITVWIHKFSRKTRLNLREVLDPFVQTGSIQVEIKKILWVFNWNKYNITDPEIRNSVIRSLREVLIENRQPTEELRIMIGLLKITGSLRHIATGHEERVQIRNRYCEIFAEEMNIPEGETFLRHVLRSVKRAIAAEEAAHSA
jgi:hypothetical protein